MSNLVNIYGTEDDRVNCPFYYKIGACRHGEHCTRKHNRPLFSQTILLKHLYQNPALQFDSSSLTEKGKQEIQEEFDKFYEDIFRELNDKYGKLEELYVCDNINEHMVGNVYAKFADEEDAHNAVEDLKTRFYAGRPIEAETSPVTDFSEARCRQNEEGKCNRGGQCNFMHLKAPSRSVFKKLFRNAKYTYKTEDFGRSDSVSSYDSSSSYSSRSSSRSKSRSRSRSHGRDRHRDSYDRYEERRRRDREDDRRRDRENERRRDRDDDRRRREEEDRKRRHEEEDRKRRREDYRNRDYERRHEKPQLPLPEVQH